MIAAMTPVIAPQPEPSLIMVGWSMQRIIWLRGPVILGDAERLARRRSSSPSMRAPIAATPSASQAPDVW